LAIGYWLLAGGWRLAAGGWRLIDDARKETMVHPQDELHIMWPL
jgi:hypothetical protein